jgi:hypothetical protein
MTRRVLYSFLFVSVLFSYAQAKPVLIAVELADRADIRRWLGLSHPTFEHVLETAIAEVDDAEVAGLVRGGFTVQVVDESPWSGKYFLTELTPELKQQVPGTILWQRGEACLIEVTPQRAADLLKLRVLLQPLKREALPARYWQRLLTKYVSFRAIGWDPFIQSLVDEVNTDSLTAYIQRLQDFGSRLMLGDSSYAASAWLSEKMTEWGYAVEFDSFYTTGSGYMGGWPGSGYERNVVGTATGTLDPSKIYVIGGHFDSIVWSDTALARIDAPGADDNASGTVGALEAARVMSGHSWDATMRFVGWAAEETGLWGSNHYANRADNLGWDIGGVVNLDMIGFMDNSALDCIVQVKDDTSFWLADLFRQAAEVYAPSLLTYRVYGSGGSDWWPFARLGFPAIGGAERAGAYFNPYYHSTDDVIETLSPELYTDITKASVATFAMLGLFPAAVEDVVVRDVGDGDGLVVTWSANSEADVTGYKLLWGTASEAYTDSHFVSGVTTTADSLTGFMTDSTYYFVVHALDADGYQSFVATEVTGVPRVLPTAPVDVAATPIQSGIRVHWPPNPELDITGYRVYRRTNETVTYDTLTAGIIQDTTLTDYPLDGAHKYYYAVQAFDVAGNGGALSEEAYGRPITLDQGIVLVDETRNHQTLPDSVQDEFYGYVMAGSQYSEYEYGASAEPPVLADLGPYSTVVWHADDFQEPLAWQSVGAIRDYLEAGGNLWFMGWQPTANLEGAEDYPYAFGSGDFVYDYAKVSAVDVSSSSDSLQGAVGLLGYPDVAVDPEKVPVAPWGGTMRYAESFVPLADAEEIYTIDMKNDGSSFEGLVCGVRYVGEDFKVVYLGFPLYYMDREQARMLAHKVLSDFSEPLGAVEDDPYGGVHVHRLALYANVPNPFSEQTVISYRIPEPGVVTVGLYDPAGRLVRTLAHQRQPAGPHHVVWDGTDKRGVPVSAGIYFYRLTFDGSSAVRRMTFTK